ncbi:unnamed protein product [Nippostrongylus brasiliensis]|uniref:Uncharacterized protein n=1 Tax=Nippostrongylus brasiliensis TaxID=27835 RepID=A0A0N4Y4Z7_NIPBR|nr:unnamed protein product [Nippostrongylus brasiliensis]
MPLTVVCTSALRGPVLVKNIREKPSYPRTLSPVPLVTTFVVAMEGVG